MIMEISSFLDIFVEQSWILFNDDKHNIFSFSGFFMEIFVFIFRYFWINLHLKNLFNDDKNIFSFGGFLLFGS